MNGDMGMDEEMMLDEPVIGLPDDTRMLLATLDTIAYRMQQLYNAQRRLETPNPSLLNLNPGRVFRTSTRMRCVYLIFSGGTAGEDFALTAGRGSIFDFFVPTSPHVVVIPLPVVFDAGIDYQVASVTTPGAVNWKCRVVAYTEVEAGNV